MFKEKDFIEIEYTGIIKETSQVFETTNEKIAKENNLHDPNKKYKPKIICIGQEQILPSLEKELINKEVNKEYDIELTPEKTFGKKKS